MGVCKQGSNSAYQGLVKLLTTQTISACLKTDEYDYGNLGCKTLETLKRATSPCQLVFET